MLGMVLPMKPTRVISTLSGAAGHLLTLETAWKPGATMCPLQTLSRGAGVLCVLADALQFWSYHSTRTLADSCRLVSFVS
jgi:hypothetical protein